MKQERLQLVWARRTFFLFRKKSVPGLLLTFLFLCSISACKTYSWNPMKWETSWKLPWSSSRTRASSDSRKPLSKRYAKEDVRYKNLGFIQIGNKLWERCSVGQSRTYCHGKGKSLNWWQAKSYCRELSIGDFQWRLPKTHELAALSRSIKAKPIKRFSIHPGDYWAEETFHDSNKAHATLNLKTGRPYGELDWNNAFIKCVSDRRKASSALRNKPRQNENKEKGKAEPGSPSNDTKN